MRFIAYCLALAFAVSMLYSQTQLDKKISDMVYKSVYEVVMLKGTNDNFTYEKELPWDLVPFQTRTDKYYSIGTAFAVSPTELVSVSHVFTLELKSQLDQLFLRDKDGKIYDIAQVTRYSTRKDYIVFTVKNKKMDNFLKLCKDKEIPLNVTVYAVGNAYGEGVIIRDGLLTSRTPETDNGEWTWLRFSAAASPGNSGGPLLNAKGEVIGVIVGKSENENLNYALPVSEMAADKDNCAILYVKYRYVLINSKGEKVGTLNYTNKLPKTLRDLRADLTEKRNGFVRKLLTDLTNKYKDNLFPSGKGSLGLLYSPTSVNFPAILAEAADGVWNIYGSTKPKEAKLDNNGWVDYDSLGSILMLYIRKPDNVGFRELCDDSKLLMDYILKSDNFTRTVGTEKVRITSFGKPSESFDYTDAWSRKWMVRKWPVEYADAKVLTFSTPVPQGMVVLYRQGTTSQIDTEIMEDMKFIVDYAYLNYYGTFSQWREFLSNRQVIPAAFSNMQFSYKSGGSVALKMPRFSIQYDTNLMEISDDSTLKLVFSYFPDRGRVVWDACIAYLWEKYNNSNGLGLRRVIMPIEGLDKSYFDNWEKIAKQKFPYNSESYVDEQVSYISAMLSKYRSLADGGTNGFIYTIGAFQDGNIANDKMLRLLKVADDSVKIME